MTGLWRRRRHHGTGRAARRAHRSQRCSGSARQNGIAILAGFAERDGDTIYNSAVFVDGGETRVYRKAFLYGDYEKSLFAAARA